MGELIEALNQTSGSRIFGYFIIWITTIAVIASAFKKESK